MKLAVLLRLEQLLRLSPTYHRVDRIRKDSLFIGADYRYPGATASDKGRKEVRGYMLEDILFPAWKPTQVTIVAKSTETDVEHRRRSVRYILDRLVLNLVLCRQHKLE